MFKKIKKAIFGNDEPPVQVPVQEDEYTIIGEEATAYEIKDNEEIPISGAKSEIENEARDSVEEARPEVKVITKKIMPKLLTARVKSPDDFENLKKLVEHDMIIINLEDVPVEAIVKEFSDFKKYLETLDYNLGKVDENVILAVKSGIDIDRYTSNIEE